MLTLLELDDVEDAILELKECSPIVVDITVVGSTEYGDDWRKLLRAIPAMHFVAFHLGLN